MNINAQPFIPKSKQFLCMACDIDYTITENKVLCSHISTYYSAILEYDYIKSLLEIEVGKFQPNLFLAVTLKELMERPVESLNSRLS